MSRITSTKPSPTAEKKFGNSFLYPYMQGVKTNRKIETLEEWFVTQGRVSITVKDVDEAPVEYIAPVILQLPKGIRCFIRFDEDTILLRRYPNKKDEQMKTAILCFNYFVIYEILDTLNEFSEYNHLFGYTRPNKDNREIKDTIDAKKAIEIVRDTGSLLEAFEHYWNYESFVDALASNKHGVFKKWLSGEERIHVGFSVPDNIVDERFQIDNFDVLELLPENCDRENYLNMLRDNPLGIIEDEHELANYLAEKEIHEPLQIKSATNKWKKTIEIFLELKRSDSKSERNHILSLSNLIQYIARMSYLKLSPQIRKDFKLLHEDMFMPKKTEKGKTVLLGNRPITEVSYSKVVRFLNTKDETSELKAKEKIKGPSKKFGDLVGLFYLGFIQ